MGRGKEKKEGDNPIRKGGEKNFPYTNQAFLEPHALSEEKKEGKKSCLCCSPREGGKELLHRYELTGIAQGIARVRGKEREGDGFALGRKGVGRRKNCSLKFSAGSCPSEGGKKGGGKERRGKEYLFASLSRRKERGKPSFPMYKRDRWRWVPIFQGEGGEKKTVLIGRGKKRKNRP